MGPHELLHFVVEVVYRVQKTVFVLHFVGFVACVDLAFEGEASMTALWPFSPSWTKVEYSAIRFPCALRMALSPEPLFGRFLLGFRRSEDLGKTVAAGGFRVSAIGGARLQQMEFEQMERELYPFADGHLLGIEDRARQGRELPAAFELLAPDPLNPSLATPPWKGHLIAHHFSLGVSIVTP